MRFAAVLVAGFGWLHGRAATSDNAAERCGCCVAAELVCTLCAQLKRVPEGLQPKTLLTHFVRVAPYFSVSFKNEDDVAAHCLRARRWLSFFTTGP